jgi:hypothetical protein
MSIIRRLHYVGPRQQSCVISFDAGRNVFWNAFCLYGIQQLEFSEQIISGCGFNIYANVDRNAISTIRYSVNKVLAEAIVDGVPRGVFGVSVAFQSGGCSLVGGRRVSRQGPRQRSWI